MKNKIRMFPKSYKLFFKFSSKFFLSFLSFAIILWHSFIQCVNGIWRNRSEATNMWKILIDCSFVVTYTLYTHLKDGGWLIFCISIDIYYIPIVKENVITFLYHKKIHLNAEIHIGTLWMLYTTIYAYIAEENRSYGVA